MQRGTMDTERFFGFKQWKSVKEVQYLCGRLDRIRLLNFYKFVFLYKSKNCTCGPQLIRYCFLNVKVRRRWYYCSYNNVCRPIGQMVLFDDVIDSFGNYVGL